MSSKTQPPGSPESENSRAEGSEPESSRSDSAEPDCTDVGLWISARIDGEPLAPGLDGRLDAHLASCSSCRDVFRLESERSRLLSGALAGTAESHEQFSRDLMAQLEGAEGRRNGARLPESHDSLGRRLAPRAGGLFFPRRALVFPRRALVFPRRTLVFPRRALALAAMALIGVSLWAVLDSRFGPVDPTEEGRRTGWVAPPTAPGSGVNSPSDVNSPRGLASPLDPKGPLRALPVGDALDLHLRRGVLRPGVTPVGQGPSLRRGVVQDRFIFVRPSRDSVRGPRRPASRTSPLERREASRPEELEFELEVERVVEGFEKLQWGYR